MRIQNWTSFNELNQNTYMSASRKLKKIGHGKRASEIEQHALNMQVREAEKYGLGECTFNTKKSLGEDVKGNFCGFDMGMTHDLYLDNVDEDENPQSLQMGVFFKIPGYENEHGTEQYNTLNVMYDIPSDSVEIFSMDEEQLEDVFGTNVLLFNNRKDAMKLLTALKNLNIDEEFGKFESRYTDEQFVGFKTAYNKMLSKVTANMLWSQS